MVFEVAVGIVLIYLVLAVVCSAATELVSQLFNLRSEGLWAAIRQMLHDEDGTGVAKGLYDHSLISEDKARKPSYIKPEIFSVALINQLGGDQNSTEKLLEGLPKDGELPKAIRPLIEAAGDDATRAHRHIEAWFESATQRASDWYAKQTRLILAFVGILVAFTCNADTIMLAQGLWSHPPTPIQAKSTTPRPASAETRIEPKPISTGVLGWSGPTSANDPAYDANDPRRFPSGLWAWALKLVGLFLTALAVSMIAPFLYNLFRRLGQGRAAAKGPKAKAAEVPETVSEPAPVQAVAQAPVEEPVVAEPEIAAEVAEIPTVEEADPIPVETPKPKPAATTSENIEVVSGDDIMALLHESDPSIPPSVPEPVAASDDSAMASEDEIAAMLAAASAPETSPSNEFASQDEISKLIEDAKNVDISTLAYPKLEEEPEPVNTITEDLGAVSAEEIADLLELMKNDAAANAAEAPEPAAAPQVVDADTMSNDDIEALLNSMRAEAAEAEVKKDHKEAA